MDSGRIICRVNGFAYLSGVREMTTYEMLQMIELDKRRLITLESFGRSINEQLESRCAIGCRR